MSESLNITNALSHKNKNIFTLRDPLGVSSHEEGPTKMNIILPESYMVDEISNNDDSQEEVEIVRVPFDALDMPAVDLRIDLSTVDNIEIGEITYGDDNTESKSVIPIGGDIIIPDQEQISLIDQVRRNTQAVLFNKLGLTEKDYIKGSGFDLFAEDESLEHLTIGVDICIKRRYSELMDWIKNPDIDKELSEDRIAILNKEEFERVLRIENGRTLGSFAVCKMRQFSEVVRRFI